MKAEAAANKWELLCDTAWPGYTEVPLDIMAGYTTIFREIELQHNTNQKITHLILQAGVGGFAAAGAAWVELHKRSSTFWDACSLVIVEPIGEFDFF